MLASVLLELFVFLKALWRTNRSLLKHSGCHQSHRPDLEFIVSEANSGSTSPYRAYQQQESWHCYAIPGQAAN
jgi:hypothetical protein